MKFNEIRLRIFLWLGKQIFEVIQVWHDEWGNPRAAYFADSIRDLNCATRDYVEMLDQPTTER